MKRLLQKFVLPSAGNIHPNYCNFAGWSFASNIVVSIQSVLSTHSMLSVINQSSSNALASMNYVGKDAVGQLGSMLYMSKMATYADNNSKKFIKHSVALQQGALLFECALPFFPVEYFILGAGLSNTAKGLSFTGFGAVNAKAIATLSSGKGVQVGEMYSKLAMVNTMGSTIGLGIGLGIVTAIPDHAMRMCLMPVFASIRYWTLQKSLEGIL